MEPDLSAQAPAAGVWAAGGASHRREQVHQWLRRRSYAVPFDGCRCDSGPVARRHLVSLDVEGRPATFATAGETPRKEAVRRAVTESGCAAVSGRFAVELEFRLGPARRVSEVWDLDNLIYRIWAMCDGTVRR